MGLSKDMKNALDNWMEKAKVDIMEKLDSVCKNLEEKLLKVCEKLEERVEKLEGENQLLRSKLDGLERYGRGDSLEIHNVPVVENENSEMLVLRIAQEMGLDISATDISCAYRLPVKKEKQNSAVPRIYVKFTRRKCKRQMYGLRIKQQVTHRQLGLSSVGKVYLHEHLTKSQSDIYFRAKDLAKENGYKFIWTSDQRVYVRYNKTVKPIPIDTEADLLKIIPDPSPDTSRILRSSRTPNNSSVAG